MTPSGSLVTIGKADRFQTFGRHLQRLKKAGKAGACFLTNKGVATFSFLRTKVLTFFVSLLTHSGLFLILDET